MASGSPASKPRDPIAALKRRLSVLMVFCLLFAGALAGRAAIIQLFSSPRLEQMARRQFQSKTLIRPRRGTILDRNGEPLVVNVEASSLAVNPSKVQNRKLLARLLSKATDIPYSRLIQKLEEQHEQSAPVAAPRSPDQARLSAAPRYPDQARLPAAPRYPDQARLPAAPRYPDQARLSAAPRFKEFAWIKRHLTDAEMGRLKKWRIIQSDGELMAGLWLVKESRRTHPHGELGAHILGTVNIDSEGLEGVELWQNEKLRGKVISVSAIKDALGRPAFIDSVAALSVQDGRDGEPVTLTLDSSLQFAVEQELRHSVTKANAKGGSVIVMNAVNGEILAMANQPSFNPNDKGVPVERRRNRTVTDGLEPGSIMKPVLLAGALSHGWKLSDQIWGERGQFSVQGRRVAEAEVKEKFEWLSLDQIIKKSSNIGAAKLALKLGAESYQNMLRSFEFGQKTGMDFPGEISGRVPKRPWQPLTLANVGFGQGILVTPIQMIRAYAAFLNGGYLVEPSLIRDPAAMSGRALARRILTPKVAENVLAALQTVTEEGGTGVKAALSGYRVAGKTGTAQKVDPLTGAYSHSKYVASFVGMALDVEPKIVIYAAIDEPRGVYFASETAAPLFREVLNAVANRFSLPARLSAEKILASSGVPPSGHVASRVPQKLVARVQDSLILSQARPSQGAAENATVPATPSRVQWFGTTGSGNLLWKMPSLKGLTPREAVNVLRGHRFQLELHGSGIIQNQLPEEGKIIADGDNVRLSLVEP